MRQLPVNSYSLHFTGFTSGRFVRLNQPEILFLVNVSRIMLGEPDYSYRLGTFTLSLDDDDR